MAREMVINASVGAPSGGAFGQPWGQPLDYNGQYGSGWIAFLGGFGFELSGTTQVQLDPDGNPTGFAVALDGTFTVFNLGPNGTHIPIATGTMPAFSYASSLNNGDFAQANGNGGWHLGIHGSPDYTQLPLGPFGEFVAGLDRIVFNGSAEDDVFETSYLEVGALFNGGAGNDLFYGTRHHKNELYGGEGNDTLHGQGDDDIVDGGAGDDYVTDADQLYDDPIQGGGATRPMYSHDTLRGGDGNDNLVSVGGGDLIEGGAGNDFLQGSDGFNGVAFDDTLNGGAGDDTLNGGYGGHDTAIFAGNFANYTLTLMQAGTSIYRVVSAAEGTDDLYEIETIKFADGTFDTATGVFTSNAPGVTVFGTSGNDILSPARVPTGQPRPGSGADTLYGLAGNDQLDGGAGADRMYGGAGNDTYTVNTAGDQAIETKSDGSDEGGIDTVNSSVSFALGSYIEKLTLTGAAAISGTGNDLANTITGNGVANVLVGGAGNDTVTGNAGNDTLYGDAGNDSLSGGNDSDTLYGGADNDTLNGGLGADLMMGGSGNDRYTVDDVGDVVDEAGPDGIDDGGTDTVSSSVSFALGSFVETLTLSGTAAIDGTGNDLANTITGNGAANVLTGGAGNDTLTGNAGGDTLIGDAGNDRLSGGDDGDALYGGANDDSLNGGAGADYMSGAAGNDTYVVDHAGDVVDEGGADGIDDGGTDSVSSSVSFALGSFVEKLTLTGASALNGTGNDLANTITGNGGDNVLVGNSGSDTLSGGAGNDILIGGIGKDTLTGGLGGDTFVFRPPAPGAADVVKDFNASQGDEVGIVASDFGLTAGHGLTATGQLDADWFVVVTGSRATQGTAADHGQFVYNATTRALLWDADGAGGVAGEAVATFNSGVTLAASNFNIFDDGVFIA